MNFMYQGSFIICTISIAAFTFAMDSTTKEKAYQLVVIPGQNGLGGAYASEVLGITDENRIHHAETPQLWIDLGQNTCISRAAKTIKTLQQDNSVENIIIHASSQGSATAFNYTAQHPQRIKALIIESMLASGNSAIHHTLDNIMLPGIGKIPGSYYILPYLAKIFSFWWYAPAGTQACHSVDKISKEIPVILVHCKQDPQLAYSDAEAIYARLKQNGNPVYLIPIASTGWEHVNLIPSQSYLVPIIRAILIKHGFQSPSTADNINLSQFQPEPNNSAYQNLITREQRLKWFDRGIKTLALAALSKWAVNYWASL